MYSSVRLTSRIILQVRNLLAMWTYLLVVAENVKNTYRRNGNALAILIVTVASAEQ